MSDEGSWTNEESMLFATFLREYLENVMNILPESHRAKQLKAGGAGELAVYSYETAFLREPFLKAIKGGHQRKVILNENKNI